MRLLPQTRRGTWLMAMAAWAGLSAGAWFVAPVLPQTEWRDLPDDLVVVGILPAGPTIVMLPSRFCGLAYPQGPVVTLNASTGRRIDLFGSGDELPAFQLSPDGRWALLHDPEGIRLLDTASGRALAPEITDANSALFGQPTFSPDGCLLAYGDRMNGRPVVRVFDVGAGKTVAVIPDAIPPMAFDPGSHTFVCGSEVREVYECRVLDWPSRSVRWHLPVQPWGRFDFSPAGDLLFRFGFVDSKYRVCCVDLLTGQSEWHMELQGPSNLPGDMSRLFVVDKAHEPLSVAVWETRAGQLFGRMNLNPGEMLDNTYDWASPTGAAVLVSAHEPSDRFGEWMEKWAPWFGVRAASGRIRLVDLLTGRTECEFPGGGGSASFLPDGRVMVSRGRIVQVWDIPPRKPLAWFAIAAAIIALPIAWLACCRVRRLRREAA